VAIDLNDKPWYVAVIVGAVLGIALFVVLQMYVFKEMQAEIDKRTVTIDELQREIEKGLAAKADRRSSKRTSRTSSSTSTGCARSCRPAGDWPDQAAQQLTERGRFRLTSFTPGDYVDQDFYQEWPIRVEVDGTYHELGLLFDRLSRFQRIINVDDLDISPIAQGGEQYSIHANFVQKTFIYKEGPAQ
jgi:type IV pilus assembly protein PilO